MTEFIGPLPAIDSETMNRWHVADLGGRVVALGTGWWPQIHFYGPSVTELIGVEPHPTRREWSERALKRAGLPGRVLGDPFEALPLEAASVDAVELAFLLCRVPSVQLVLGEVLRILRPGGVLAYLEHLPMPWASRDPGQHCDLRRDCRPVIAATQGLTVVREQVCVAIGELGEQFPAVLGRARRVGSG